MLAKVLVKTGAPIKSWVVKYKAVVQVTDVMMTVLEGFYHRNSRQIVVMTEIKGDNWEWEWDSIYAALEVTWI